MRYDSDDDKPTFLLTFLLGLLASVLVSILIYQNSKLEDQLKALIKSKQTITSEIITANPVNTPIVFSVYVNMDIIHVHENLSISSDKFGYLTTLENYKEVLIFLDENSYIDPIRKSNYRY